MKLKWNIIVGLESAHDNRCVGGGRSVLLLMMKILILPKFVLFEFGARRAREPNFEGLSLLNGAYRVAYPG